MIAVYYYQHGCKNYQFLIKIDGFRKKNFKSWWSCTIMPVSLHPLLYSTISRRIYDIGCIQNDTAHWALNKLFLSSNWYIPLDLKIWSSVSGCCFECIHWLRSMMHCRGNYYSYTGMFVYMRITDTMWKQPIRCHYMQASSICAEDYCWLLRKSLNLQTLRNNLLRSFLTQNDKL